MDERGFEAGLERLFSQPPAMPDAEGFTRRVEHRLNRNWRWRTLAIGAAGVVGGGVAVTQALNSGLGLRVKEAQASSSVAVDDVYRQIETLIQVGSGASLFWVVSALLVVAAVVAATRALEQV